MPTSQSCINGSQHHGPTYKQRKKYCGRNARQRTYQVHLRERFIVLQLLVSRDALRCHHKRNRIVLSQQVSTPTIARSSIPIARPELAASFLNPSGKAASLRREPSSNLTNTHAGTMQRASEVVHTSVSAQYGESSLEAFFAKNTPATTQQPTCRAWSSRKACTSP